VNFRGRSRTRRESFHLDLTPMIDVVFQLVLFLLLSTTFKKEDHTGDDADNPSGFQVDLPRSSASAAISEKKDLEVWIAKDGSIYIDKVAVDSHGLQRQFRAAAAVDPDTLIILKADKAVSHGRVVAVMDLARNEGLTKLAIATSEGDQGP
jgi:biopolymer transport protein ExbD